MSILERLSCCRLHLRQGFKLHWDYTHVRHRTDTTWLAGCKARLVVVLWDVVQTSSLMSVDTRQTQTQYRNKLLFDEHMLRRQRNGAQTQTPTWRNCDIIAFKLYHSPFLLSISLSVFQSSNSWCFGASALHTLKHTSISGAFSLCIFWHALLTRVS